MDFSIPHLFDSLYAIPDFISNHILPYIEDVADTVTDDGHDIGHGDGGEGYVDESEQLLKDTARQNMDAAEKMVKHKEKQVMGMTGMIALPVALLIGAFLIKIVYSMFTKTADTVGKGVKTATAKIKTSFVEKEVVNEDPAPSAPPKDPARTSARRRMLFGEVLKRFVVTTLSDADIERAVAAQREGKKVKKIGEVLVELGAISKTDVAQALKIQEKSGS
ncbi:MAG: hypothetical protein HZA04_06505 [Nitrospinae bacterium]|nr:hypothetical protein [Nitrospinota bacterium]